MVVAASCGIEPTRIVRYKPLLDAALAAADPPARALRDPAAPAGAGRRSRAATSTGTRRSTAPSRPTACRCAATDPLYILYTSGTTGRPKGIVRDNGGHAVALRWSMPDVFDIGPGDVFWAASDVGWVVGHSYIVYAPLLTGATTVLYEGKPVGTPDAGAFFRVVARARGEGAVHRADRVPGDQEGGPGRQAARRGTTWRRCGRCSSPASGWTRRPTRGPASGSDIPVVDHWWQTETGWPIAANLRGLEPMPTKPGSPSVPVPGYDVRVVDGAGEDVPPGTDGAIVIRLPLPPGCLPTLWNDDERYVASYLSAFPGHYLTGDGGRFDEDGYLYVMGRTDDVINVAGHRLSTGAMEEVLAAHPAVAECAVIGVADAMKGQVPRGLVVLKAGVTVDEAALAAELVAAGARPDRPGGRVQARSASCRRCRRRGRARSCARRCAGIADGREEPVPSTIEDPAVLDALRPALLARDPAAT